MVAVTLLTGVLLFCSVFFLVRRANREITQRSFDELATATRQIAKDLVDAANADQTILSAMAELIAGHDERDNDAVLRIMKSFSLSETFVSTVALLRPDGHCRQHARLCNASSAAAALLPAFKPPR